MQPETKMGVMLCTAALVTGLLAMISTTSCKTSGNFSGGFDAGPVGLKGTVAWEPAPPQVNVQGTLPEGDCLQLDYYDDNGNQIGSSGKVRPPYVGAAPDGWTGAVVAQIVPCDEETPEELVHAGPNSVGMKKQRFFYWCPKPDLQQWDPIRNTTLIADVWGSIAVNKQTVVKQLMRVAKQGLAVPPPAFIDVVHYSAVKPAAHGDAELIVAQRDSYASGCSISATGATPLPAGGGTVAGWNWLGWQLDIDPYTDKVDVGFDWVTPEGPQHFGSWFAWQ